MKEHSGEYVWKGVGELIKMTKKKQFITHETPLKDTPVELDGACLCHILLLQLNVYREQYDILR